jgi:hypothetical protein
MTRFFRISFFLILCLILCGWGSTGHKIINKNTIYSFPDEMAPFRIWQQKLEFHSSDADKRKSTDPTEGPKHYIDIDNYPEFNNYGFINQNFDSLVAIHGYSFVMNQGILPWAIIICYDSLISTLARKDWDKAILFAADLGHYVGDAHMPLHLTRNYNGQYSGQTGIHSRYETTMINRYQTQLTYEADTAYSIENVSDFVFQMIYENYNYLDSLLAAELAAKNIAGSTSSDYYYQKFWEFSRNFTIDLFRRSSDNLASLIYTAWINAGSPYPLVTSADTEVYPLSFTLDQNYPNPFNPTTTISFSLAEYNHVTLSVYSADGALISVALNGSFSPGTYKIPFDASNLSSGVYYYSVHSGAEKLVRKMLLLK